MRTFHLHIRGRVQGVGFRPHVYKVALEEGLTGFVRNDTDGVHVIFNCRVVPQAERILNIIVETAPSISIIRDYDCHEVEVSSFSDFKIASSGSNEEVKMLIAPDLAICKSCSNELQEINNKRHRYPFITCTQCGPRYSIIQTLAYDRPNTTMAKFRMCNSCDDEYEDALDRRHYSQTNSCPQCPVNLFLHNRAGNLLSSNSSEILDELQRLLKEGNILAVKGIGGYVLMCDATNRSTINTLRERKHRVAKPFAVMYASVEDMQVDVHLTKMSIRILESPESPILLLPLKSDLDSVIANDLIAPGLDALGVMLPYTGLYQIIARRYTRPLIVTSGNISDSPIIFDDQEALNDLTQIADYILTNDREIVVPQDDSVLRQCEAHDQFVVLRRSRGMAPSLKAQPFKSWKNSVLTTGADLKSSFGIFHNEEVYLSQYLGNLEYAGSQKSYRHTLDHFYKLLKFRPKLIVSDLHPSYFSSLNAKLLASESNLRHIQVQHHIAHFAANLGENDLINATEPILGVVCDGTGYGQDGQIWGGEFFIYSKGNFERAGHLKYFEHKYGDKMVKEPRLSAFSLFYQFDVSHQLLRSKFSEQEWKIYTKMRRGKLNTSSFGRVFDGVASMLGLCDVMSFEGEAAMYLEQEARVFFKAYPSFDEAYPFDISNDGILNLDGCFQEICRDKTNGISTGKIACKFHFMICQIIENYARRNKVTQIAFSGGVFQNAFLVDSCKRLISDEMTLYFHNELSPNDENIAFGQLVLAYIQEMNDHI